jgi:hypothetical protein
MRAFPVLFATGADEVAVEDALIGCEGGLWGHFHQLALEEFGVEESLWAWVGVN